MGGSIGLAIKKHRLARRVVGISRHRRTLALARQRGAVDIATCELQAAADAELLILALPVEVMVPRATQLARIVAPCCCVTDVASTKQEVVSQLERIFPAYVGSHPLAGSEKKGVVHASATIFEQALCVMTPTSKSTPEAIRCVKRFWQGIGSRVQMMSPTQHDRALAFVSHLPHAVAFSLMAAVPSSYFSYAAAGMKDTTRIAGSDSQLWAGIFLSNRTHTLKAMAAFARQLGHLRRGIQRHDHRLVRRMLAAAQRRRQSLAP